MITIERVSAVLDQVRPFLQADGGDLQLVGLEGNSAHVRLTGRCADCPSAYMTLHLGVEAALRSAIPGFGDVRLV
jgi:Fe-S cluster biogenesis protein NfuA